MEEKALRYVAKAGDGSMRDALSLLDQCIAFHLGEKLTYENVLEVLGAVDTEVFSKLLRAIINRDVTTAISILDDLVDEGREMGQLVNDFTWYMRNLLLLQSSSDMEEVLDMSADNLVALREEAKLISPEILMRYIRIFSELSNQIRYAGQKRILIEVALIKLCRPEMETEYDSLVDRLEKLEYSVKSGVVVAAPQGGAPQTGSLSPVQTAAKPVLDRAVPEDIKQVISIWKTVISEVGNLGKIYYNKAVPTLGSNNELLLMFDDEDAFEYISGDKSDCQTNLKRLIENRIGKSVEISVQKTQAGVRAKDSVPNLLDVIQFEIEEEDF